MTLIQARHYTSRPSPRLIDVIVLHSTEGGSTAKNVALWFAGPKAPQASAHYVVDEYEFVQCVRNNDIAWHAPGVNPISIGVEHVGFAHWTADEWPAALKDLSRTLLRSLCHRFDVPKVFLQPQELVQGHRGITTHKNVSLAFHKSTHVDPGDGFGADEFIRSL